MTAAVAAIVIAPAALAVGFHDRYGPLAAGLLVVAYLVVAMVALWSGPTRRQRLAAQALEHAEPVSVPASTSLPSESIIEFGPNGAQVASFLGAAGSLSRHQWELIHEYDVNVGSPLSIVRRFLYERAALDACERAVRVGSRHGALRAANLAALSTLRDADLPRDSSAKPGLTAAVLQATLALVSRDVVHAKHFAVLYEPFAKLLPPAADQGVEAAP